MNEITRNSLSINAESQSELLEILLRLNNHTPASYCSDMGITEEVLESNQPWAINALADLLDANLIHLGYVAKDAKHEGVFGEYDDAVKYFKELQSQIDDLQQPIIINKEYILSSVRTIKVSILSNAMQLITQKSRA